MAFLPKPGTWRCLAALAVFLAFELASADYSGEPVGPANVPESEAAAPAARTPGKGTTDVSPLEYQHLACDQIVAEMSDKARVTRARQDVLETLAFMQMRGGSGCLDMASCLGSLVGEVLKQSGKNSPIAKAYERDRKTLDQLDTIAMEKACAVPMTAKFTKWHRVAYEQAKSSCRITGLPVPEAVTQNIESYRVPCNFAEPVNVRCDSTGCQKMASSAVSMNATPASNMSNGAKLPGRPLRVAIVPLGFHPAERRAYLEPIEESLAFVEEYFKSNQLLELKFAYYDGQTFAHAMKVKSAPFSFGATLEPWTMNVIRNEPQKYNMFHFGRHLNVDVIFTMLFELRLPTLTERQQSEGGFRLVSTDIYLFDIPREQMYVGHGENTADQISQSIRDMFSGYLKSIGMPDRQ
jgi:hypothetical protein